MPNYDSYENIVTDVLGRMDEATDGTSDFDALVRRAIVRAHHDLHNHHPWLNDQVYPPGAFVTTAQITNRTITIAAAGVSVAGTLSSTYPTSLVNYKIIASGKNWYARITAHTAGTAAVTLDAVPEALAAGTVITIFLDEYSLAADLGLFTDNRLWTENGWEVELWPLERMQAEYPHPPVPNDSPKAFARITRRVIRLSEYPINVKRFEYNYTAQEADPSGTADLTIPQNYRWLLSDGGLYFAYLLKSDRRAQSAQQDYERGLAQYEAYDRRLRMGVGTGGGTLPPSPYR